MSTLEGKLFAFRILDYKVNYKSFDADKEVFLPHFAGSLDFILDGAHQFTTEMADKTLGTYVGQNAYGASVKVTKISGEWFGIRIRREDFLDSKMFAKEISGDWLKFSHELKMPIDRARTIDAKSIAFLAVGSVEAPGFKADVICMTPKFDSPFDGCTSTKHVLLKTRKFVLYNLNSGDIFYESAK